MASGRVSTQRPSSFLTVYRYITSPAIPLISWTLFPPPPNPPGAIAGVNGGGPMGRGDSLVTDEGENTGGGGDVSSVTVSWDDDGGCTMCLGGGGGGGECSVRCGG